MTLKRMILLVGVALALAALPATASALQGGSGLVTPRKVGPLTIGAATQPQMHAFAGHQTQRVYCTSGCGGRAFKTYLYRFPNHGLTSYTFALLNRSWVLEGFYTNQRSFHTQAGTKVGMSSDQAKQREKLRWRSGCMASGLKRTVTAGGKTFASIVSVPSNQGNVRSLLVVGPKDQPCR
jgi:hypothetical protein